MKIVLAGSPEIAIKAFRQVIKNFDVIAIVTQPDRPSGRGLHIKASPVALLGEAHNIRVFKPKRIAEIEADLAKLNYDLLLTFAFGQYIPANILALGNYKPLNIHGSLLPKYRGAAPIHYAILNNDSEIGITLMAMTEKMDEGDVYFQARQAICPQTTTGEAFIVISDLAATNIVAWLQKVFARDVNPRPQSHAFSLSPKINKSFGELSHNLSTYEVERRIRGLNPFPGTFFIINDRRVKVFDFGDENIPGALVFKTSDGQMYFTEYQYEGKKRIKLKKASLNK